MPPPRISRSCIPESYHGAIVAYLHGVSVSRLQLSVGAAATIVEEWPRDGDRRMFAARAPHESAALRPSRLLVHHPPPPTGPTPGALLDRMASIRAVSHPVLAAPLATGADEAQAWIVEPAPMVATLADRLAAGSLLPVHDTVRLLRDGARALAALPRRGLHHGALDARVVTFDTAGLRIFGLGRCVGGSVAADLRALGQLAQLAMMGDTEQAAGHRRHRRHAVPEPLAQLLATLVAEDSTRRPLSADAVLTALDWFPSPGVRPHRTLLDGVGRGARPPGHLRGTMLLAAAAVLLFLFWLLVRAR
jgi:hypothetical protein